MGIISMLRLVVELLTQVALSGEKNCHCAPGALHCRMISLFESRASWQCLRLGQLTEKDHSWTGRAKQSNSHKVVSMVDWAREVGRAPP